MDSDIETTKISEGAGYRVELVEYNKDRRPKRFYYRKCGMEVGPWPYDEKSQKYYLSKGFLLEPPENPEPQAPIFPCQICKRNYNSLEGLIGCLEKHKEV